jgi:hypothetical protein
MSSVSQYPSKAYFIICNTDSTELGSFDNTTWGDLSFCQIRVYHKQSAPYSHNMNLVISSKAGGPALATSTTQEFSNSTTGQATGFWLGNLVFSFTDYKLVDGEEYFLRLEVDGYSRAARPNQDDSYLGVWCDWYEPVGTTNTAGARAAFGVKR